MKICLISNLYPPNVLGGAEISVKKIAESLVKSGNEVIVITTADNKEESVECINGVKIYRINPVNIYRVYDHPAKSPLLKPLWHGIDLWNPGTNLIIKNILKNERPDIAHIHNFKGLSASSFSVVKNLGIPLVFTAHDFSLICLKANLIGSSGEICLKPKVLCRLYNEILKRIVNNNPDVVISPSKSLIDVLSSNGLFKDVKTVKIPHGIELNTENIVKKYKKIKILYTGNLGEHKGVDILISAFKNIKNENIQLDIVGKGQQEKILKEISKSDHRINFHGFLKDDELSKMYKEANISIVPSIWFEVFGLVILESFRYGTPVIGANIGGIPELIENSYNGYLFEAGNISQLQNLLENLINDPESLKRLEKGALESVKDYSMEEYIRKLEELYESLLS